jgi:hypothetical protein
MAQNMKNGKKVEKGSSFLVGFANNGYFYHS